MATVQLYQGDNRPILRGLIDKGVRVQSCVCDAPYGLTSVVKRFGKEGSAPAKFGRDGAFSRQSAGFMGSLWDGTGIERDPEFWRLIHDILLPGGYVLAFGSPRTGHWQACAMETAGFVMHPFFAWVYGSGLPKAHNAAMAIDQALGVKGTRGGAKPGFEQYLGKDNTKGLREGTWSQEGGFSRPWMSDPEAIDNSHRRYIPSSVEAAEWEGWAYGTQSCKPALEPIYFGQRPFSEKTGALNILKHGVGAINIDDCRVELNPDIDDPRLGGKGSWSTDRMAKNVYGDYAGVKIESSALGRHPANFLHDASPEAMACFPDAPGQLADASTRVRSDTQDRVYGKLTHDGRPNVKREDSGSAARFFNSFPLAYCPKAGKLDRAGSLHPTVKPVALLRWLCRLITPPGGTILDPFAGSGTTGEAASQEGFSSILIEAEAQYATDIRRRFNIDLPSDVQDLIDGDFNKRLTTDVQKLID